MRILNYSHAIIKYAALIYGAVFLWLIEKLIHM